MKEKNCPQCKTTNPVAANFCRHCRYEFPEATKSGGSVSPVIRSFKVLEGNYTKGSIIHFDWIVENATIIKLNEHDVTSAGSAEMTVEEAETIILSAENDYDITTRKIRLSPSHQPTIRSFSASYTSIHSGQEVNLKWEVRNTVRAKLVSSEGEADVTNTSSIKVVPHKTETFRLICYSCDEKIFVEKCLQVCVISPVLIRGFFADKDVVAESSKVTLTWDVENATSIMLYPFMKDITKYNHYEVSPSHTTEYRIVAKNPISQDEASISVGVRQLPKMDLNIADNLSKIEIPSFDIDLSHFSDGLEKTRIDEWMTTKPLEEIHSSIRLNRIQIYLKKIIKKVCSIK